MSDITIRVENLGKRYRIGAREKQANTLRESLQNLIASPFDYLRSTLRGPSEEEILWALKDVSFEVRQGEVLGLIGRNGAGKSTLLKILSRITQPTEGRAEIYGRTGSLLEVGTGFHPELTGRENIYMNGAILGMSRAEIARKFDEIVDFSGVEKFIDTPVKRYSSGMYVRLAFAVAAHLEPEILLVDEVLAMGDAAFQKKCLGQMKGVTHGGRTVLFVSHNMGAVSQLCERTLWLDGGRVLKIGPTHEIIYDYLGAPASALGTWTNSLIYETEPDIKLLSASIVTAEGVRTGVVRFDEAFSLELYYKVLAPVRSWWLVFRIDDLSGTVVFSSWDTDHAGNDKPTKPGIYRAICHVPRKFLRPGTYSVILGVLGATLASPLRVFDSHEPAFHFEVSNLGCTIDAGRLGVITPVLKWSIERIGDE